jgi:hypothetical protein
MKLLSKSDRVDLCARYALAALCAALVAGCQTQTIVLSPPMHARVVDGETKRPLDDVRVTLISRDGPETAIAYSDHAGFVDLPGLLAHDNSVLGVITVRQRVAVHAIFEHPGYEPYTIDSVNGYGFFKGYTDVHLYPY